MVVSRPGEIWWLNQKNTSGKPRFVFWISMPISTALQIARFCSSARQAGPFVASPKKTPRFPSKLATFWKTQQVSLKFSLQGFFLGGVDQSIILSQNYTIYGGCNCSFLFNIFVRNLSPIFEETQKTIESTAICTTWDNISYHHESSCHISKFPVTRSTFRFIGTSRTHLEISTNKMGRWMEGLVWTVRRKWSMGDWYVFMPTFKYIYIYIPRPQITLLLIGSLALF